MHYKALNNILKSVTFNPGSPKGDYWKLIYSLSPLFGGNFKKISGDGVDPVPRKLQIDFDAFPTKD